MFLTEPIIEDAWNESVAHVRPYIGEVVECFSPPLRVHPVGETVRERDNYSSGDNRSLFSSSDDDGSMRNFKQEGRGWHQNYLSSIIQTKKAILVDAYEYYVYSI